MKHFYFFFFAPFVLFAQVNRTADEPVKWDSIPSVSVIADTAYKNFGLVILKEHTIINMGEVKKIMQVKVQNADGLNYIRHIYLPESFDLTDLNDGIVFERRGRIHYPFDEKIDITAFGARRILPGDKSEPLAYKVSMEKEYTFAGGKPLEHIKPCIELQNINVGDEIQIIYKIFYNTGAGLPVSKRIFFSGLFPKQEARFDYAVKTMPKSFVQFTSFNGAEKYLTKKNIEVGSQSYSWELKNVWPTSLAPFYRPQNNLPYVQRFVADEKNAVVDEGWSYAVNLILSVLNLRDGLGTEYKDKNTTGFNKFYDQRKKESPDTPVVAIMNTMHNYIVKNTKPYSSLERELAAEFYKRPGELLQDGKIYIPDAIYVYNQLLKRLNTTYYMAVIADKRINRFEMASPTSFVTGSPLFVLTGSKGELYYYFPKRSEVSYFTNEFPFYLEGADGVVFPEKVKEGEKASGMVVKTAGSIETENVRQINLKVTVDSSTYNVNCVGKVSLQGQFSTLTRNVYLHKTIDSTINPLYRKSLFPEKKILQNKIESVNSLSDVFPFRMVIDVGFESKNMTRVSGNEITLDLSGMIHHVIWNNVSSEDTVCDYYNDFRFTDVFRAKVVVPAGYKCTNAAALSKKITNEFGRFEMKIVEMSAGELLVESSFSSAKEIISAHSKKSVIEIFDAIRISANPQLVLKKEQ